MAKQSAATKAGTEVAQGAEPRSLSIAQRGVKTGDDFARMMSALMSDLIEGRVTPSVGNATCNAGGKLLKVVEMKYKYGTNSEGGQPRSLTLAIGDGDSGQDGNQHE